MASRGRSHIRSLKYAKHTLHTAQLNGGAVIAWQDIPQHATTGGIWLNYVERRRNTAMEEERVAVGTGSGDATHQLWSDNRGGAIVVCSNRFRAMAFTSWYANRR